MQEKHPAQNLDAPSATWFKSSYSTPSEACVEVSDRGPLVAFRDSKDPEGPELEYSRETVSSFITAVVRGDFNQHDA